MYHLPGFRAESRLRPRSATSSPSISRAHSSVLRITLPQHRNEPSISVYLPVQTHPEESACGLGIAVCGSI